MVTKFLVAAAALLLTYLYRHIRYKRLQQYAHFPQLPPSAVLGHLQVIDDFVRRSPPKSHPDVAFAAMYETLGRPSVMFVDLRPIASPLLVIGDYQVAEQIVKSSTVFPYSPPKEPQVWDHMVSLVGPTSILPSSGEHWKSLRKRFNPGFAPQHLMTLLPSIVGGVRIFMDQLENLAQTGTAFSLQNAATNLTFDVIGKVALDVDMGAQTSRPTELMRIFRELIETFSSEQIDLPRWCTPRLEWNRRRLAKQIRGILAGIVRDRHAERTNTSIPARSILAMSLKDLDSLSPTAVDVTCDQLSSFLFAGHDTTGTTIAWTLYELFRTPHALQAVRAELDDLFGTETSQETIVSRLLAPGGEELIYRMSYTSAVIRETLRLWPPAATARLTKPGDGLNAVVRIGNETKDLNLDGLMLYNVASIIQRDPAVFGDTANAFVPERWLQQDTADKIPSGAWRAFERGPRNCIGQELALIEARIVIAMVARRYDFVKVGLGAAATDKMTGKSRLDGHGQYEVEKEMYSTRQVTPKPVDGMEMQVRMAVAGGKNQPWKTFCTTASKKNVLR